MRMSLTGLLGASALLLGTALVVSPSNAADHLDAPLVQKDGRTDINDVYAFQSPNDPANTVLAMTVNPAAGILSPTTFDPKATYKFYIDDDGDAYQEDTIRAFFGPVSADGSQRVHVRGAGGRADGLVGEVLELSGGGHVTTGVFDDPFFFDFQAFQDQVKGAGGDRTFCDANAVDFFAGFNATAIVVELPSDQLTGGSSNIGVWAETRTGKQGRIDRMGRPAIATVLIDDGMEDAFNDSRPDRDRRVFGPQVEKNLLALSGLDGTGYTPEEAAGVADVLLPDILTIDTSSSDGFLNGRQLTDDVIDTALTVVTGGLGANGTPVLSSDCVDGNDVAFSASFPYLAPAN